MKTKTISELLKEGAEWVYNLLKTRDGNYWKASPNAQPRLGNETPMVMIN